MTKLLPVRFGNSITAAIGAQKQEMRVASPVFVEQTSEVFFGVFPTGRFPERLPKFRVSDLLLPKFRVISYFKPS
ncbi:MAG: hypothetical protein AB1846_12850, partial [Chloroflexota bacterium]